MCLIVVKPAGLALPNEGDMANWFETHPDGFGLAFQYRGKVKILKGAMNLTEVFGLLAQMGQALGKGKAKNIDIVFHFRQATDGVVNPGNCHPFPITTDSRKHAKTSLLTTCALAHNGIISHYSSYFSYPYQQGIKGNKTDTQQFIEDYLAPIGDTLFQPKVFEMVGEITQSKFALLLPQKVLLSGKFVEDRSYLYSNGGYQWSLSDYQAQASLWAEYDGYERREWRSSELPAENTEPVDEGEYALVCDSCESPTEALYELYGGEYMVCSTCFKVIVGRKPEEHERYL